MSTIDRIMATDTARVPVMTTDRCIRRKEQARLARELFKRLGLKGISVTAPNYSMASSVHVRLPNGAAPDWRGFEQYEQATYSQMPDNVPAKQQMLAKHGAALALEKILDAAFPAHVDRSDYQSDYFDYRWSVS